MGVTGNRPELYKPWGSATEGREPALAVMECGAPKCPEDWKITILQATRQNRIIQGERDT